MRDFLSQLIQQDIHIDLVEDELSVRFPKNGDHKILDEIKFRKRDIIEYLSNLKRNGFEIIPAIPATDSYPISHAQRRLWVLSQFNGSIAYNLPSSVLLSMDIDIESFKRAIESTIDRHEILRTVFRANETGEIKQWVLTRKDLGFKIDYKDFRKTEGKQELVKTYIREDAYKAYDLENGPLLRGALLHIEDTEYIFYNNMHHIISDGWSVKVLSKDVFSYYEAYKANKEPKLKELRIQYKDYSAWALAQLEEESFKADRAYWLNNLAGELPVLDLPGIKQRPRIKTHNGQGLSAYIDSETTGKLRRYSQENGGSLFMGLLAAWNVLMYRYTGQKDLIIGTPIAGREHADLEDQIGFYVNTLALRNEIKPEESFDALFSRVKQNTLNAYSHQMYPFDRLVDELDVQRDTSRSAVFDVMLALQNNEENTSGLELKQEELDRVKDLGPGTSKFDIDVAFQEQGDYLSFSVEYNTDVYELEMVEGLINHYRQLLNALLESPEEKISHIDYLSQEEKHKLLVTFNDTEVAYPKEKTIVDLFEEQVAKTPDNIAVVFEEKELSYKDLNEQSNQLAHYLQKNYAIKPDDLVGIKQERSEWMMISILGILKSGGAYVPIDPEYPQERIDYIEKDTKCKVCLDEIELSKFRKSQNEYSKKKISSGIKSDNLIYVIYTSGSTGKPKGVLLEHSGVVNRLLWMRRDLKIDASDVFLQKTPTTFDVSVWELLLPLITGSKLVVARPEGHKDPLYLGHVIERCKISIIHFVPSMLSGMLENINWEKFESLRHVICSGEALPKKLEGLFKERSSHVRLQNYYGPTEASVDVTAIDLTQYPTPGKEVSIGKPVDNTSIYIVNEVNALQPLGVLGEILIGGVQIARGYLNQEELTKEKFIQNPFKAGERLYKTGDLGRWLPDGNIEFIGRKDDQVKIRGYRIELGEIEHALQSHKEIEEAVVLAKENQHNEKELVAYITGKAEQNTSELRNYLKEILPEYMLPAYYVQLESLPLTSNGKIDKKSLPDPQGLGLTSGVEYVAPRNEIEEKLVKIWQEVLQRENIGVKDDFFALGGHSLKAVRLSNEYQKELSAKLSLKDLFAHTSIESHAELIQSSKRSEFIQIEKLEEKESYPISDAQRRLWVLSQFEGSSVAYNMPASLVLEKSINIESFKRAIESTIERHEILRTVFKEDETGEIRQWILNREDLGFKIDYKDFRKEENKEEKVKEYITENPYKAFDLEKGPLLRASLIQVEDEAYVFYYNMHHIIGDGWSMEVLRKDVFSYYEAYKENKEPKLKELRIQYKDYSAWQLAQLEEESFKAHRDYWLDSLKGELPLLNLPGTKQRPRLKTNNGHGLSVYIDGATTGKLKKYSRENGGSLFMGLLAAWNILIYRYTGQQDIIIGTPIAGREHADLEDQIGFYVNTLALRNEIKPEESFNAFYRSLKDTTLKSYNHHMYPFDRLVEELNLIRDTSRSAVFDIMLDFQNNVGEFEGFDLMTFELTEEEENQVVDQGYRLSKFDIDITFQEIGNYLSLQIIYNPDVYEKETVEGLMIHYKRLLHALLENPEELISEIDFLSAEEKQKLLYTFNDTQVDYPQDKTIVDLFEEQVKKTPDNVAVVFEEKKLTYRELNKLSNQLAHYLQKNYQIKPDDLVGIKLERSEWIIISILGILKSGGAYVPIDPEYPQERIDYIEKDTKCKVSFDEKELTNFKKNQNDYSSEKVNTTIKSNNLAYVIYTSGTTGQPKGVMVTNSNVINIYHGWVEKYGLDKIEVNLLQMASMSFDVFMGDICRSILVGGKMVLCPSDIRIDSKALYDFILEHAVSIIEGPPATLLPLMNYVVSQNKAFDFLKIVIFGSDILSIISYRKLQKKFPGITLINSYGTTETTIDSSFYKEEIERSTINNITPIGKPFPNTSFLILDSHNQLLPIGFVGELHIGGDGLALGYLNKAELTAEKFIANPFKEGERLYKTGDLGRWLSDGNIEFIGREDNQVKIRGYRIELGEIEHALLKNEGIKEAVVIAKDNQNNEKELVAYITSQSEQNTADLRSYLKEILPEYMLPAYYVQLESLPLTSNGKIDKKSLPDPEGMGLANGVEYVAPRNTIEERLVKIWQEVLQREHIGVKDDFFALGGHSLKAVRAIFKVNNEFKLELKIGNLYNTSTIESIANIIDFVINQKNIELKTEKLKEVDL